MQYATSGTSTVEYRRRNGSDTWHWCRNCSQWPTSNYDSKVLPKGKRPSTGELHNECKAKEDAGTCRS